jgi:hypothetical protein
MVGLKQWPTKKQVFSSFILRSAASTQLTPGEEQTVKGLK